MLHHLVGAKCGQGSWDAHGWIHHSLCQVLVVWEASEYCEYMCVTVVMENRSGGGSTIHTGIAYIKIEPEKF